jgi:hypothetical protein
MQFAGGCGLARYLPRESLPLPVIGLAGLLASKWGVKSPVEMNSAGIV